MNDDPTPILWAPCLGKSKEYLHHCAYIRVPTQYHENELKVNGAEGDSQRPCLGSHLLGAVDDENGDLLHDALPSSSSPAVGFDIRDKIGEQESMRQIITGFEDSCKEDKKLNKDAIRDVVQDLPKEDRDEVCKEPVKPPEECKNVVRSLTVSDCKVSTRTIHYHPAETSQVCVSKVPCGCDNHITYIPKITEGVPEPTCTVETVPIKKVSIVTECTTNIDPDYVRRYIASFLRTHPEKDKILRLATAIERRRIEGYNFWDPKSLRLFVRRYTKGHPKKAIFLVGGGPGKAGYDLDCLIETYACWLKNNYVLYVIHPRGTGNSSRIPTGLNLTDSMLNPAIYISEMYHPFFAFTVTNSAMDVYNVFQREKLETHYSQIKWYIHACSYGTLVAQRLMVLKPDELDGVILDGVISPNPNVSRSLLDFGHRNNEILKNCMRNDHCRRQIKSVDNFINIFHRAEKQKTRCARFIAGMFPDSISYKRFIRSVMNYYFEKNEVVGVQFAYALGKCPNYSHFVKFVQANLACWMAYVRCDPLDMHPILFSIIMQSEIVGKRMLIHDSRYRELGKITCSRDMVGMGRKTFSPFNYMLDKSAHEYAFNHKTAVLILQGRLDGVTPVDNSTDVYQKSNPKISKMVIFENEGHTVSCSGSPCLDTLMKEFYDVPMSIDTIPSDECLRTVNMGTLNFEGWEQNLWFGWDWLLWLILALIILVLIIVLVYFIYRYLKKRNQ